MENYKSLSELNKINHNKIIYVDTVNIILLTHFIIPYYNDYY
jgi:hypothetical protein